MAADKENILDEKGQAIFELIVFTPLFLFLFTIIYNVGSSINISINQQKAARRYFYYLSKGNSSLPLQFNLDSFKEAGTLSSVGMAFIGFRQQEVSGESSLATCMKFSSFLTGDESEECEDGIDRSDTPVATSYIRIYTGYGVCGETFRLKESPHRHWDPFYGETSSNSDPRSLVSSCIMSE